MYDTATVSSISSDIMVRALVSPVELYQPLVIPPDTFMDMYNLDISEFIDTKPSNRADIMYLSFAHALRLFRRYFPDLAVEVVEHPLTGLPIFPEHDGRGYFVKTYIHNGTQRSEMCYFSVRNNYMGTILPTDVDKNDRLSGDAVTFDKAILRAKCKVIAQKTGIGLKLWTGDDFSKDIMDAKMILINQVLKLAEQYEVLAGKPYDLPDLTYMSSESEIKVTGKTLKNLVQELKDKPASKEDAPPFDVAPATESAPITPAKSSRKKSA